MGFRKKNKHEEDDGVITSGHLRTPMNPIACKKLKGYWDPRSGECDIGYKENKNRPKELKTVQSDEYINTSSQSSTRSNGTQSSE